MTYFREINENNIKISKDKKYPKCYTKGYSKFTKDNPIDLEKNEENIYIKDVVKNEFHTLKMTILKITDTYKLHNDKENWKDEF